MAKETEDKLAKLAKESGNDFKKLDEMEKEFKLNESPGEESKLEKTLDKAPIFPPNTPNNPTNPGSPANP